MGAILDRFKEPSSYAGLAGLLGMFGLQVDGGLIQSITYALSGVCGVVAFFLRERGA